MNCMKARLFITTLLVVACGHLAHAQDVTVTAKALPDDSVSQPYMALDRECRNFVSKHDAANAVAACKKVGLKVIFDNHNNEATPADWENAAQQKNGLWFDTYVHEDDIRAALNLAPERGAAVGASVNHIARLLGDRGWGPATLALDGLPQQDIGAGGRKVTGDPYQFVIVASGRADPATLSLGPDVNLYP